MPITGGKATPLLTGMAFDVQPRFSPDGKKVVFISDRSGGDNVWTLSLDLKDTTALTQGNGNVYYSPEYSPDGKYIAVSRAGSVFGAAKLQMYHVDGGGGLPVGTVPPQAKVHRRRLLARRPLHLRRRRGTGDWQYNAIMPQYQLVRYDRQTGQYERRRSALRVGLPAGALARRQVAGLRHAPREPRPGSGSATSPPARSAGWPTRCSVTTRSPAPRWTSCRATRSRPTARRSSSPTAARSGASRWTAAPRRRSPSRCRSSSRSAPRSSSPTRWTPRRCSRSSRSGARRCRPTASGWSSPRSTGSGLPTWTAPARAASPAATWASSTRRGRRTASRSRT